MGNLRAARRRLAAASGLKKARRERPLGKGGRWVGRVLVDERGYGVDASGRLYRRLASGQIVRVL